MLCIRFYASARGEVYRMTRADAQRVLNAGRGTHASKGAWKRTGHQYAFFDPSGKLKIATFCPSQPKRIKPRYTRKQEARFQSRKKESTQ